MSNPAPPLDAALRAYRALPQDAVTRPAGRRREHHQLYRLSDDQIAEAAARYDAGQTMTDVAQHYGVRRKTISAALGRTGIPLREMHVPTEAAIDQAVELYRQGWSTKRVGEALGFDAETARKYLRARGVQMRPPGRPRRSSSSVPDAPVAESQLHI